MITTAVTNVPNNVRAVIAHSRNADTFRIPSRIRHARARTRLLLRRTGYFISSRYHPVELTVLYDSSCNIYRSTRPGGPGLTPIVFTTNRVAPSRTYAVSARIWPKRGETTRISVRPGRGYTAPDTVGEESRGRSLFYRFPRRWSCAATKRTGARILCSNRTKTPPAVAKRDDRQRVVHFPGVYKTITRSDERVTGLDATEGRASRDADFYLQS